MTTATFSATSHNGTTVVAIQTTGLDLATITNHIGQVTRSLGLADNVCLHKLAETQDFWIFDTITFK